MANIADRIKNAIQNANLTYEEIAQKTNISKSALQRYATGETKKIPLDRLEEIAKVTNVSPAYLMGWEYEPSNFISIEKHPLMQIYDNLNDEGQKILMSNAEFLNSQPQYKKCDTVSKKEIS